MILRKAFRKDSPASACDLQRLARLITITILRTNALRSRTGRDFCSACRASLDIQEPWISIQGTDGLMARPASAGRIEEGRLAMEPLVQRRGCHLKLAAPADLYQPQCCRKKSYARPQSTFQVRRCRG